MTAQGRCEGCGTNGELKAVRSHIVACVRWAALFRADQDAALPPAEAYARWHATGRLEERDARVDGQVSDTLAQRAAMHRRFASEDILEE
jgi:hypothetical protein